MKPRSKQALSGIEDCEALIFDDGDGLAILGPRIWPALAKLKSVGEERRVPIILVASTRLATKIAGNDEWRDRFETVRLPRLRLDRDFLDLLTAWEARLPLRDVSHLSERDLAMHLYALCDGSIGRLAQILRKASLAAIESATERITVPLLDNLGFSPPPSFKGFPF